MNKNYSIILIALLFLASCSKVGGPDDNTTPHEHDDSDDIFPVITVEKPLDDQQFQNGDTIFIKGTFTDNKKLYIGWIRVRDDATTLLVREQYYETHVLQSMPFDIFHKTNVTQLSNYTITIEMEDHGLNKSTKIIKVKVNP